MNMQRMRERTILTRAICSMLTVLMLGIVNPARAEMLAQAAGSVTMEAVSGAPGADRQAMVDTLVNAGVERQRAEARIATLSDMEVQELSDRFAELPAGSDHGNGFFVAIAAIFAFLFGWMLGSDSKGKGHGHHHHGRGHGHGHAHH